jgi:hypothetical protein
MGAMLFHRSNSVLSRSARTRVLLLASIAALVVTSFGVQAAPVAPSSDAAKQVAAAGSDEFGARKRVRARRNDAAGLAMMGMMVGTIGAVIASQQRRDYYEDRRRAYYGYSQPYVYNQPYAYHQPYGYESKYYQRPRIGW